MTYGRIKRSFLLLEVVVMTVMSMSDILARIFGGIVNTSGKAGAQIPHLPLGDDPPPWGR
jgi:hypothetical protein